MTSWFRKFNKVVVVFGLLIFGQQILSAKPFEGVSENAQAILNTCDSLNNQAAYSAIEPLVFKAYYELKNDPIGQVRIALKGSSALMLRNRSDSAIELLNKIRRKHREVLIASPHLKASLFEAYADLALDFSNKELREKAIQILTKALRAIDGPSAQRTSLYYKLGRANRLTKRKVEALDWFNLAEEQAESSPNLRIDNAIAHGYCLVNLRRYDDAMAKFKYAESLLNNSESPNPESKARLLFYINFVSPKLKTPEDGDDYLDACITHASEYPEIQTNLVAYAFGCKASLEESGGDYAAALKYRNLQVQHLLAKNSNHTYALAAAYGNLALCYRYLDKNDLSCTYWESALSLYPKDDPVYRHGYPERLSNYAEILIRSNRLEEGLRKSNEVLEVAQLHDSTNAQLFAHTHLNRAHVYKQQSNWLAAIEDLKKAASFFEKMSPPNWHLRSEAMLECAHSMYQAGQHEEAIAVYEAALRAGLSHKSTDLTETIGFIISSAAFESECLGDQEKALKSNQKIYNLLLSGNLGDDYHSCPKLDGNLLPGYTIQNTQDRIKFLRRSFAIDHDQQHLDAALNCGLEALTLLRDMRQDQNVQKDKISVNKDRRTLFQLCIETAYDLYTLTHSPQYLETAFEIAEQSKAMILMSAVIENRDLNQGFENKDLIDKKKELLATITSVRQEIMQSGPNSSKLRKELLTLNNRYDKVVEEIQRKDPRYFELIYDFKIASPKTIQKRLAQENRALIEYFYGDSTIFIFALTRDTFFAEKLAIAPSFTDSINAFSNQMKVRPDAGENALNFAQNGKTIYDALWILPKQGPERVTVIPDGPLSFLSFEALPTTTTVSKEAQFQDLHYLIEDQAVSYNYSGTFFNYGESKVQTHNASLLAMAPTFEGHKNVKALKETAASVEKIGTTYPSSKTLTGIEATKANFLRYASQFDIIDLATHGIADSSNSLDSRLFFSVDGSGDSILYLSELYNLKLDARLAILEACETGTGDFDQGEGVTSLARGFTYAGCKSILMSLWQVSEGNTTSQIMKSFYHNMSAGLTLDMAIAKAKRSHLQILREKKGSELWKIHPFFWSELVLIGEDSPIKTEPPVGDTIPWVWIAAALLLSASIGIASFRRIRSKRKKAA